MKDYSENDYNKLNRNVVTIMNKKKLLSYVLCIVILFITAISTEFVAHNYSHDCPGNDCSVCLDINRFQKILNDLQGNTSAKAFVDFIVAVSFVTIVVLYAKFFASVTPITLKDKLSN